MAINNIGDFSGGSVLDISGGAGGAGGMLSGAAGLAGLSSPLGWAQLGISLLSGSSVKIEQGKANGETVSGLANFGGDSTIKFNKPMVNLSNPVTVVILGAVLVGAIYAYKRYF